MIFRALFFDNSEEFGQKGILGQAPRKIGTICEEVKPEEIIVKPGHRIACHIPLEELTAFEPIFN